MRIKTLLEKVRSAWIHRVAHDLARGAGVRENFEKELSRFFSLFEQAALTGDPSWLDPILYDWANAPTETDIAEGQHNLSTIMSRASALTFDVAKENLSLEEALELLSATSALFAYALSKAAHYESDTRVSHISNELASIQQKLEQLDRSKSNFISVAAHELKTPLTLIEGYTSMMRDLLDKENKSAGQLLEGVQNGVRRLREIVDDMIDVSLIDNSLLSLNFQPLWLNNTFSLLQNELLEICNVRQLTLDVRAFLGSDQLIFADPERIYQALRNVLTNAIKYTPDKGTISIDGRLLPGFIEITVADTGIGISDKDQSVIFDKFRQLGEASLHSSGKTKFKGGGPGLGLPITRGIIEAHGGTIWVDSPGYDEKACPGSTFHILLPDRSEATDPKVAKLFRDQTLPNTP
ncbi:MAG: HAMP domain-containing histidine kinase [Anaerolineae bacterium]|jgi:signal transduction histidine kinase|nr:HAMP domain-containing histidine kinase [Anaerolineae bacterium]MBT7192264.1 HAMP domain-containing histidine kinase [Anaerolineae bacterium]MBT7990921.1 HAMP domain-containing histidine kinase [Anaerolineae bacterium]